MTTSALSRWILICRRIRRANSEFPKSWAKEHRCCRGGVPADRLHGRSEGCYKIECRDVPYGLLAVKTPYRIAPSAYASQMRTTATRKTRLRELEAKRKRK
jgi:hypothetical protein